MIYNIRLTIDNDLSYDVHMETERQTDGFHTNFTFIDSKGGRLSTDRTHIINDAFNVLNSLMMCFTRLYARPLLAVGIETPGSEYYYYRIDDPKKESAFSFCGFMFGLMLTDSRSFVSAAH